MREALTVLWIAGLMAYVAEGQGRKKGKEIPTQISERGKLIFEDDFSGKELQWLVSENGGEWRIVKKALATQSKSVEGETPPCIRKAFTPMGDVIVELRVFIPLGCKCTCGWSNCTGSA